MRILIAVDKFKGSLSGPEVARAIERGLRGGGLVGADYDLCPIADGGEGMTQALVEARGGVYAEAEVEDALGRVVRARYGVLDGMAVGEGRVGVMEMSAASGLAMVLDQPLNPRVASTFGTGQLMRAAVGGGLGRLVLGIGGSATNDGGVGMALALGYRFLDAAGAEVRCLPAEWERVERVEGPESGLQLPPVLVACDVDNPLLGERGCTTVYGGQKGVRAEEMAFFERRMERLAEMVERDLGLRVDEVPGAGAAGGLGFGLMVFAGGRLQSGFDLVADLLDLRRRVAAADVVITGEGSLDQQTLNGKGPVGVARMARAAGVPVFAVAGGIERGVGLEAEFDGLVQSRPEGMPVAEAMRAGAGLIEESVEVLVKRVREYGC